ncbi:MAG: thiol peroxidase [Candidatus Omnitrophica bacterium]|jgi:thiol peroxidase|nr:thiol peroxidase [Candidatus Omnitrophota bacterium]
MTETVLFKGNKISLVGPILNIGDNACEIIVVDKSLKEKKVGGKNEKVQLIITVPSLDTSVCQIETKKFNELLSTFKDIDVNVISMDLPFAQDRFCESFNVKNISVLSDFRYRDMEKYGVIIGDGVLKGLIARAVFIINKESKIIYKQLVPEIGKEPDYEEVLNALK